MLNKKEFLEILKDYLSNHFSQDEVNDILRDYEEYFIDGEIEGKSDIQIIESLGSPKSIVRDLVGEMKESKINYNNKRFDRIHDSLSQIKLRTKETFYKTKDVINNKLTPNLKSDEDGLSTKLIKFLLAGLSFILLIIWIIFILVMVSAGITIVALNIAFIALIGTSGPLFALDLSIALLIVFISIGIIGFDILGIQVYLYILKLGKTLYKRYMHWLKNKKKYIVAKERKINYKGDDIDE
ncbi:membrane protein [[Clostridium] sordellii]|nr:membrane protein [[Clostridium] sordellii] [Paeniclostridium sordellii]CEP41295.1 membrane protein [[Clostridium] sordellii] [Paeniclostridium sordellii]CEQ29094.1 membrane protein [[Clostridium] sordellii] [Paeniclostridium sordellii]